MTLSTSTIGIDFGTTNSVLAVAENGAQARVLPFTFENSARDMVRTALAFRRSGRHEPVSEAGPWAIDMFLEAPEDTRFLQSFKSFAASHAFTDTAVFARRFNFSQLLEVFLLRLGEHAGVTYPKRLVIGRPVTFAGAAPDEALAHARYTAAFTALGFDEVQFDYVRSSTDSGMKQVDFGGSAQGKTKMDAITGFTEYASEKLHDMGAAVSADVYGVEPHNGRGGWTWYTGSAGWMMTAAWGLNHD